LFSDLNTQTNNASLAFVRAIAQCLTGYAITADDVVINSAAAATAVATAGDKETRGRLRSFTSPDLKRERIESLTTSCVLTYTISFTASSESMLTTAYSQLSVALSTAVATGQFTEHLETEANTLAVPALATAYSSSVSGIGAPVTITAPSLAPTSAPTPSPNKTSSSTLLSTTTGLAAFVVVAVLLILICFVVGFCTGQRSMIDADGKKLPTTTTLSNSVSRQSTASGSYANISPGSSSIPATEDMKSTELSADNQDGSSKSTGSWFTMNPTFGLVSRAFTFVKGADISVIFSSCTGV
jgi:hypothetical protein